jgi:apolipoprotein N-acyltransferase
LDRNGNIRRFRDFLQDYPNLKLVTGVSAYHVFDENEPHSTSTRKEERNGETIFWEAYNAALQLENDVDSIPFYIKSKLVPGAETMPYPKLFAFLKPLVDKLDGAMEGHGVQANREAFASASGKVAPVICYESVFGEYHAGYIRAGAEAIFIVTNDGWWDNSAGHKQHLAFASLRAIETRRSVARSANTGISCFLNQRGDILQPTKYGEEAAIKRKIKFNDEITFYVKWGDLIGRVALFIAAIIFLNTISKSLLKKED